MLSPLDNQIPPVSLVALIRSEYQRSQILSEDMEIMLNYINKYFENNRPVTVFQSVDGCGFKLMNGRSVILGKIDATADGSMQPANAQMVTGVPLD